MSAQGPETLDGSDREDALDAERAADVLQRVLLASESMITGPGPLKRKLLGAIEALVPLREEEFPTEGRAPFSEFFKRMTARKPPPTRADFGSADWTSRTMTGPEALAASKVFLELHNAVMWAL